MPRHFVKIVNRGTYTSPKKAGEYVRRKLAEEFFVGLSGHVLEIRMLESAELALYRSQIASTRQKAESDDGIPRRWVTTCSSETIVRQLLPISKVGTRKGVTRRIDNLLRRQQPTRTNSGTL
jgi:hypothetical protein